MLPPDKNPDVQENLRESSTVRQLYDGLNELELYKSLIEESPVAAGMYHGRELRVVIANSVMLNIWGKDRSIIGMPLAEAVPELEGQPFLDILDNIFETGETYSTTDAPAILRSGGVLGTYYFDFTYRPLFDNNNKVYAIMNIAVDVTGRVMSTRKLTESEGKFRTVMNVAPAAVALFVGRDVVIEMPNQAFKDVIGKGDDIEGKTLSELLPELESQPFLKIIDDVFTTGKPYQIYGAPVSFERAEGTEVEYFNIIFTPLFNDQGEVYAILDISVKVTDTIKAQLAIAEAETSLRGAIELAELGTWSLDPKTGLVSYSERMLQWFGFDGEPEALDDVFQIIHPEDRQRIANAVAKALEPGDGMYDEEYTVINRVSGRERILHAQGKTLFDTEGNAYLLTGTAQDITTQRKIQTALENEVAERTLQLELANKGLEDANRQLLASNEELAQYAYVASHDLQEPLRKITMFSNLLNERDSENAHTALIEKIVRASRRMSSLIKDLLEFSRLLNTDIRFVETDLTAIVRAIRDDFELMIDEKDATIDVNNLPVLEAVPLQMNQLFYNLISNALKFIPDNRRPHIQITCAVASEAIVQSHIISPAKTEYYIVSVEDNGIGIDEQYLKQIFDVFKRLHGRDEYSGSGIGLAICRRIVNNHKGAIYVESTPGEGTAFRIVLPKAHN
ncbi:MAG: PAS domain-containing sensor histidine kinase [Flavobacterium sp.]